MSKSFRVRFCQCFALNIHTVVYFPFSFPIVLLIFMLSLMFRVTVNSFSFLFFIFSLNPRFDSSRSLQYQRVFFLLLFLTYIVGLCHCSDVMLSVLSLAFLSTDPFIEVLPGSSPRMVPSILQAKVFIIIIIIVVVVIVFVVVIVVVFDDDDEDAYKI